MDNLPQNQDIYLPGDLGALTDPEGNRRPIKSILTHKNGAVTITIGPPELPPAVQEACRYYREIFENSGKP